MITYYHKLVRDGIPDYLEKEVGIHIDYVALEDDLIFPALTDKLKEEINEFYEAASRNEKIVELADIQEVINAITLESKLTIAQREQARVLKFEIEESKLVMHIDMAVYDFVNASTIAEKLDALAYMQQAFNVLILDTDITLAEVDRARYEKIRSRGAFLKRLFLISTEE